MQNLYETVKDHLYFNKFVFDELVCIEYNCPVKDEHLGIFSRSDYIIHILSGKKTWKTIHEEFVMTAGETLFVKKGAAIVTQDFDDEFCMLGFFLPDNLIRDSLNESISKIAVDKSVNSYQFTAARLVSEKYLDGFFQSMFNYFSGDSQPPEAILKLKLKELLINIVFNCKNPELTSYLKNLTANIEPSLTHIMETNFCFNLKIEEFAEMSHRSLSKFKRDFFNCYNMTPGKWLLQKRLEHAAKLLVNNFSNITQVAFECGFEDVSHFSRVFKGKYGSSPSEFRKSIV